MSANVHVMELIRELFPTMTKVDQDYVVGKLSAQVGAGDRQLEREMVLGLVARLQRHQGGRFVRLDDYRTAHADEPRYLSAEALRARFADDWLLVNEEARKYNLGARARGTKMQEDGRAPFGTPELLDALCFAAAQIDIPVHKLTRRRYLRLRTLWRDLTADRPHDRPLLPNWQKFKRIGGIEAAIEQAAMHRWDGTILAAAWTDQGEIRRLRERTPPTLPVDATRAGSTGLQADMQAAFAAGLVRREEVYAHVAEANGWKRTTKARRNEMREVYDRQAAIARAA